MPFTNPVEMSVMTRAQILGLLGAIEDAHDLRLMYIGVFCGPRASEALGLQWKCWTGDALTPHGTAYAGQFYKERVKTKASRAPIPVPEPVRPVIEAWRKFCADSSPEALIFPTFGRGDRTGRQYRATGGTSSVSGYGLSLASWGFRTGLSPFR